MWDLVYWTCRNYSCILFITIQYHIHPINHPNYSVKYKNAIGKFKDELDSICLEEFIELRPKCYSLLLNDEVKCNKILHTNPMEK